MKTKAFTIAEILSVLIILGVVAAITIPATIRHQRRQQTITRLRIAYNMLTELTERSRIENNYVIPPVSGREQDWNRFVRPYLQIAHDCGNGRRDPVCFAGPNGDWYKPDGSQYTYNTNGYGTDMFHKVILKNGMSLAFASCSPCMGLHNIFVVDIDGPSKGYSKMGQDVFVFEWARSGGDQGGWNGCVYNRHFTQPELVPYVTSCKHWQDGGFYSNTDPSGNCKGEWGDWWNMWAGRRTMCAAWIIQNNWQFPDDYPWDLVNRSPANFHRP